MFQCRCLHPHVTWLALSAYLQYTWEQGTHLLLSNRSAWHIMQLKGPSLNVSESYPKGHFGDMVADSPESCFSLTSLSWLMFGLAVTSFFKSGLIRTSSLDKGTNRCHHDLDQHPVPETLANSNTWFNSFTKDNANEWEINTKIHKALEIYYHSPYQLLQAPMVIQNQLEYQPNYITNFYVCSLLKCWSFLT